ncbi:hypothetical protein ANTRET_LOCUS7876 [Anthophora retusa]
MSVFNTDWRFQSPSSVSDIFNEALIRSRSHDKTLSPTRRNMVHLGIDHLLYRCSQREHAQQIERDAMIAVQDSKTRFVHDCLVHLVVFFFLRFSSFFYFLFTPLPTAVQLF